MSVKKNRNPLVTRNGRTKINGFSRVKLEGMIENAKPKLKDKIANRLKLIK